MDFLSDGINAISSAAKSTINKVGGLNPFNKEERLEWGSSKSPGNVYIKSPGLQGCFVAQLAPYGTVPAKSAKYTLVMADPVTAAELDLESKEYKPSLKNPDQIRDNLVVCKRGAISLMEKTKVLHKANCSACIVVETSGTHLGDEWPTNSRSGRPDPHASTVNIPCLRMRRSDGIKLQQALQKEQSPLMLTMSKSLQKDDLTPDLTKDIFNTFSEPLLDDKKSELVFRKPADDPSGVGVASDMADFIFKLCEIVNQPLAEGIHRERLLAHLKRVILKKRYVQDKTAETTMNPVTFERALDTLCKRPWCNLFPEVVFERFNIENMGKIKAASVLALALAEKSRLAVEAAAKAAADEAARIAEELRLAEIARQEKAKVDAANGITQRMMDTSRRTDNIHCLDCSAEVDLQIAVIYLYSHPL